MSNEAVYRTAPATPGLLIKQRYAHKESGTNKCIYTECCLFLCFNLMKYQIIQSE